LRLLINTLFVLTSLKYFTGLLLLCVSFISFSQERTLSGVVIIDSIGVPDVTVMNRTQKTATITDRDGIFVILAKPGDELFVSSVQTGEKTFFLTELDFAEELFVIYLEAAVNMLKEVEVVEYASINATSLGLIPADFKRYTPAEKQLLTARNGLDRILNALSGRTKKLRQAVAIEAELHDMERIQAYYSEDYVQNRLKIPLNYMRGFHVYLLDNKDFMKAFKSNNRKLIDFLSLDLANKYRSTLKD